MAPALAKEHCFDMTPFNTGRRNASVDSQATLFSGPGGRRRDFFVADEDQAVEDQYIFTSIRYDAHAKAHKLNPVCCKETKSTYLFKYHFDRLKDAAGCRGWYDAQRCLKRPVDLHNRVVYAVTQYEQKDGIKARHAGAYKVRIKLKYHGNLEFNVTEDTSCKKPLLYPTTLEPYDTKHEAAHRHDNFVAVLDMLPTNKSLHTKSKTEWRPMYDYARFSACIDTFQDPKEVLLFNCDGEIMDGSITTPYFFRNGTWVTPHVTCGGQTGVTRRWAIDQGLAVPGVITVDSLRHDEVIWLSNAVQGFFTARFTETPDRCAAPSFRSKWSISSSSSTAVDTPVSDKARSFTFIPMPEIDDLELSPCCTREMPASPAIIPTEPQSPASPASTVRHLDIPIRNKKPPLFRIPQFLGRPAGISEVDTPPRSPSGDFSIDPLSYSHATFCL